MAKTQKLLKVVVKQTELEQFWITCSPRFVLAQVDKQSPLFPWFKETHDYYVATYNRAYPTEIPIPHNLPQKVE